MKRLDEKKVGAPKWSMDPFRNFVENAERLDNLLHLCISGVSVLRAMPTVVEVINKVEKELEPDSSSNLQRAKKQAALAQREVMEGFPVLRAQAVIAIWSSLEAAVRTFLARWLQHADGAMQADIVQRIKVKVGEYEALVGEEKYFYLLDRIEQEVSSALKPGVGRFESLLEPFHLSGAINDKVRRDMLELNQVRNVLVHRYGVVDRRLTDACPWMTIEIGQKIQVDAKMTERYMRSAMEYAVVLIVRVGEKFGANMSEFKA